MKLKVGLKPCPFCGGPALTEVSSPIFFGPRYTVYCPNCYDRDSKVLKRGYDLRDAARKWNQREEGQ